jgi:hypothetical protein
MTINDNWGVHHADENHKSVRRLVHVLVKVGGDGRQLPAQCGTDRRR